MNFGGIIRGWYEKNKRDLPWRLTKDPYRVWLSEVILQQTRVDQGLGYYLRFVERFPDVTALARAHEDEVLKAWQGLGYYSRARNLHRAAIEVVERMDGRVPSSYGELLKLKGVGDYTAAAVASICFGEPRAALDGNVTRVIARLFDLEEPVNTSAGKGIVGALATELLDREDPGTHNQAMMEFGALQCIPVSPDCEVCPLADHCGARAANRVHRIPAKRPGRKPVDRWFYFYIIYKDGETILTKRGTEGIWKSLYQFPVVESDRPLPAGNVPGAVPGGLSSGEFTVTRVSEPVKHQLTHRTLHATFVHLRTRAWPLPLPDGWERVPVGRLDDFPVPRLINRYMEVVKI